MGVSTDAILFFGIDLGEDEGEFPFVDDDDGLDDENYIAGKMGLPHPEVSYAENPEAIKEYWKKKGEILEELGCGVGTHCSGSYPMYYVYIKGFHWEASRGNAEEINPTGMMLAQDKVADCRERLRKFCELLEVPYSEPKWQLVSYWGE